MGKSICAELCAVQKVLDQSIDGVNEFLIAQGWNSHPYLIALEFAKTGELPRCTQWDER